MITSKQLRDLTDAKELRADNKKLRRALEEVLAQCEGDCGWGHDDNPDGQKYVDKLLARWRKVLEETKEC